MPAPGTAQFVPPPYALHMCLHLPAGVHYYPVCSGMDSWPRNILSLVGAVHCVQVSGSHQIQLCRKGRPQASLILPEHHHVVLPQSLHSRVSVTATGLTRASVLLLAATYHPRHLRKWVRSLPHALLAAVARKLTRYPATAGPLPRPPRSRSPVAPPGHCDPQRADVRGPAPRLARHLAPPSPTYAPSFAEQRPLCCTTICWNTGCSDCWRTPSLQ